MQSFWECKTLGTVKQLEKRCEAIAQKAKANSSSFLEELQQEGYQDFHDFSEKCPQFPIVCSLIDLAELGSGCVLFFRFVRYLGIIFCLLFVLQVPCLVVYAGQNWLEGWQWSDWRRAYSGDDQCMCIGRNDGIDGLPGMPPQSNYGTSCQAWDSPARLGVCSNGSSCPVSPGQWMCRKWCFAASDCPARPRRDVPSLSNVHFMGLVRAYSSCHSVEDDLFVRANCNGSFGIDTSFNASGADFGTGTYATGPKWLGPGNFGPSQAESSFIPTLYLWVNAFCASLSSSFIKG